MKKKIIYIIIALAIITVVVIRLKSNKKTTENKVYHYNKEQAINVQADTVKLSMQVDEYFYTGTFEPDKESKISTDVQGKIKSVLVDVGSVVRKGQALIQLDNSLLKLQLQAVDIQIEGLEADVKRYLVLAKADAIQGVQLEKAELGLKSAKIQKATIQEQINKTTIAAPFNGIVTAKFTEVGSFAAPGIPLLQITDISNVKFTIYVPENDLIHFSMNQKYSISADIYPETILPGKVILIGSKANMGSSFPVQFSVANTKDLKIKAGMFGKAMVKSGTEAKQIIIQASLIVGTSMQPKVYLVKNGKAYLQDISISSRFGNKAIISDGLSEGDIIITNGFVNLFSGANVIIK